MALQNLDNIFLFFSKFTTALSRGSGERCCSVYEVNLWSGGINDKLCVFLNNCGVFYRLSDSLVIQWLRCGGVQKNLNDFLGKNAFFFSSWSNRDNNWGYGKLPKPPYKEAFCRAFNRLITSRQQSRPKRFDAWDWRANVARWQWLKWNVSFVFVLILVCSTKVVRRKYYSCEEKSDSFRMFLLKTECEDFVFRAVIQVSLVAVVCENGMFENVIEIM